MNEISKYFVPCDRAKKLEKLGFDWDCIATTDQTDYIHIKGTKSSPRGSMVYDTVECPLFSQVFDWFREKYRLDSWIYTSDRQRYWYSILKDGRFVAENSGRNTYEEAELACLDKLIEIAEKL